MELWIADALILLPWDGTETLDSRCPDILVMGWNRNCPDIPVTECNGNYG